MSDLTIHFSRQEVANIKKRFSLEHLSDGQALENACNQTFTEEMSPQYFSRRLSALRTQTTSSIQLNLSQKIIRFYESIKFYLGIY